MPVVPVGTVSGGPGYLVADMIEETLRYLWGVQRPELNRLTLDLDTAATQFNVDFDLLGVVRGAVLSIDDELIYVYSTGAAKNVTDCIRGFRGSTPAGHTAKAIVEVNSRWPRWTVRQSLKEEIRSLGPELYSVRSGTLQTVAGIRGYDLTGIPNVANLIGVMDIQQSNETISGQPDPASWPHIGFRYQPAADRTAFPSGKAVVLAKSYVSILPRLNLVYAAPFDVDSQFDDTTDLIGQVGMVNSQLDIPPLGVAYRLLMPREISRMATDSQGQPIDLRDVPPDAIGHVASRLKALHDGRVNDEIESLHSQYPIGGWGG